MDDIIEPDDLPEPQNPKRPKRRALWHGLRVSWWLLMLPVIFAFIAALAMIDRDITAPSWIVKRIESKAEELLAGGALTFDDITVNVGTDLHPRVVISQAALADANGETIAEIAQIKGLMSPRGLVLQGQALMQDVNLSGVNLNLRRNADGSVAVAFNRNADAKQSDSLIGLLEKFDAALTGPNLEALETINVEDLSLNFADARADRAWVASDGAASLDLRDGITKLSGTLSVAEPDQVPMQVSVSYESPQTSRAAVISTSMSDVRAQDIATQSPALAFLSTLDAPLSASLSTTLAEDGAIGPLNASLDIGAGSVELDAAQKLAFDEARLQIRYFPDLDQVLVQSATVRSDWGRFDATGQVIAQLTDSGLPEELIGQFALSDISLTPEDLFDAPITLDGAHADLRLHLDPFRLDVGQLVIIDPDLPLTLSGGLTTREDGLHGQVDWHIPDATFQQLLAVWPETRKPKSRKWVVENMYQATLSEIAGGLRLMPDQPIRWASGFGFSDTEFRFLRNIAPMEGASGYISFVDNSFGVTLDRGTVAAPQGGRLDFAGTTMLIPVLTDKPSQMQLALNIDGSMTGALAVLNQPPFQFLDKANLPVTLADGRARIYGDVSFPIKKPVAPSEVAFDMAADLTRVSSDTLIPNRTLRASLLTLSADNSGVQVRGSASVDGVPMAGTFQRQFSGTSTLSAQIELSPRFLDAFNIALPRGSVSGSGQGQLDMTIRRGEASPFTLTSNLRGVSIGIPAIGWSKSRRSDGNLRIEGTLGGRPRIDSLAIGGGGLDARGSIRLNANGTLDRAQFSRVRLGNWLNAPITLRGRGRGRALGVEIGGGTLDLRRANFGSNQGESGPVNIALDRMQITDGVALTNFRGDFDGAGGFSGQFSGQLNGATAIQGTVVPQNGRSAVRIVSDNAGGVARSAGLMQNATGGSLDLTLLPASGEGTFDGTLAIRQLRVRDAPAMAALLDAISVVGLLQQLDGQGLSFEEVDAKFRLTPRQVVVTESSAVGPGLGISLDGIYTLANKQVDFQGVISPFYLLNGIGSILTRKGEGLIGFNFNIAGSAVSPNVSVNPLSALTPGMFREIFRRAPPVVSP